MTYKTQHLEVISQTEITACFVGFSSALAEIAMTILHLIL